MNEYKLKYHSEIPTDFADTFKIELPSETKTFFNVTRDLIIQEFEDGTAICVKRDSESLNIYANKPFNQTLPVNSEKIIISFDSN